MTDALRETNETDREITDIDAIGAVLEKADICRIALIDENGYPYIIPMFFGYSLGEGALELYFRCDEKGKKFDLLKLNNSAGFEIENIGEFIPSDNPAEFTAEYRCITGTGVIENVTGIEKITGLNFIMKKYLSPEHEHNISEQTLNSLAVLKLTASEFCCIEHTKNRQ